MGEPFSVSAADFYSVDDLEGPPLHVTDFHQLPLLLKVLTARRFLLNLP